MSGRFFLMAAAVAATAAATAGCASVVSGTAHEEAALSQPHFPKSSSTAAAAPTASSSDSPTGFPSTSALPSTSAAPSSTGSSGNLPVINDVRFTRPSGLLKRTDLQINHPFSQSYKAEFLIPRNEPAKGKDALAIVLYDLPAGSRPATAAAQKQFIERYDTAHNVSVTDGVRPHRIAGYPGFSVIADEPPDYHYLGFYLFGTDALVEVTCQYDKKLDAVATACGRIVGSMRVSA